MESPVSLWIRWRIVFSFPHAAVPFLQTWKANSGIRVNLTELVIDPSIIDPSDSEFLQELLLQTINAAIAKGKETAAAEMKKLTGGLGLPPGMGF